MPAFAGVSASSTTQLTMNATPTKSDGTEPTYPATYTVYITNGSNMIKGDITGTVAGGVLTRSAGVTLPGSSYIGTIRLNSTHSEESEEGENYLMYIVLIVLVVYLMNKRR
jgi:hypothetical protein